MKEDLFRKKSMEQLSAPEQLTGYLRVAGPGVWFVLIGIIVLLAGLLIWGTFGRIISSVSAPAVISDGKAHCYVLSQDLNLDQDKEIEVTIGDVNMTAVLEDAEPVIMDASNDPALYRSGYLSPGSRVMILTCPTNLTDGIYDAKITVEKLRPISLIFAKN